MATESDQYLKPGCAPRAGTFNWKNYTHEVHPIYVNRAVSLVILKKAFAKDVIDDQSSFHILTFDKYQF